MALLRAEKIAKYEIPADMGTDMVGGATAFTGSTFNTASRWPTENCVNIDDNGEYFAIPLTGISGTTVIVCGNFWLEQSTVSAGETRDQLLHIVTSGGAVHCGLSINYTGQLLARRQSDVAVGKLPVGCLKYRRWQHIELKAVIADAPTGSITVKIDGVQVYTISGIDTGNGALSGTAQVRFYGIDNHARWMDIIVMDGSGSAPFNDFLDDYRIEAAVVDADGAVAAWTPTGAVSNFDCIDDALGADDEDTTYIESSTATQVNLASHAAVSLPNVSSILGVQVEALARTATTGSLELRAAGSSSADSPTKTLTTAYQWQMHMFQNDPDTGAAWADAAAINGTEFGVELIS